MGKRQKTEGTWNLPKGWVHRLALFLVAVLLILYLGALLAHLLAGARFYVNPDVDLYQRATSILAVLLWVTGIVVVLVSVCFNLLEILVAFLQAFIFAFLTALFISQAVVVHQEHGEHETAH